MQYSIILTLLTIGMFLNWMFLGHTEFTLWAFGFVSGITVASWVATIGKS